MFERPVATEQHLVEPDRHGLADAIRVVDQHPAVVVHSVHHGVPVAAQISRDLRHCSAVMANLESRPTTGAAGDPGAPLALGRLVPPMVLGYLEEPGADAPDRA